ncbi:MAG: NAD(P)-dependent alcohol dehydrogenase [Terriglobales bacterium]
MNSGPVLRVFINGFAMKAITYSDSPEILSYAEVEKPTPGDDEVLLKVRAASVNPADWRIAFAPPDFRSILFAVLKFKVRRPGLDVAGCVEAVGRNVNALKPGDAVFGAAHGAFAEYACASPAKLALKPENVTFEQAASVAVAGTTALQGLREHGKLQPGQNVLINGAAGGVGTFAVQIAKVLGAEVAGVCSTRNVNMIRSLGATRVIDYSHEDFTTRPERYDLLLDNVGNHSFSASRRILKPNGRYIMAGGPKKAWQIAARSVKAMAISRFDRNVVMFMAKVGTADLVTIGEFISSGKITPVIDQRYTLSEAPQAMSYAAQGHARGKVLIVFG